MEEKQNNVISQKQNKDSKPRGLRVKFVLLLIALILLVICFTSILFLWYGGFVKDFVCGAVKKESIIWNKFSCSTISGQQISQTKFPLEQSASNSTNGSYGEDGLIQDVVEQTAGGVVGIGIVGDGINTENQIIGTGFIVSKGGLIVSNRHVVEDETLDYFIMFKDNTTPINVNKENIFRDPVNDIALIKIEANEFPANISAIALGDSDMVKLGQTVIAIGNPLGKYTGTITKGIISGLNREVKITQGFFNTQTELFSDVIQTDAAINPGNSGGPLINVLGEAVGINFATIEGASNLSFALPINRIKQRIIELEENGKFKIPFVGIEYQTRIVFVKGQSTVGGEVTNVIPNSPASTSGVKKGDIIIQFNGQDLNSKTLLALIQETKIGQKINIVVIRSKVEQELVVEIGER